MLPVIALVGRPNVGKSTLFNLLTRTRDALVADFPGLTRDRKYGFGKLGPGRYVAIDTGGLTGEADGIQGLMARQTQLALDEADLVFFMVDGREGLTALDGQVAELLRRLGKPVRLLINKVEGQNPDMASADFHALAMGDPVCISASHGHNIPALMDDVFADAWEGMRGIVAHEFGPASADNLTLDQQTRFRSAMLMALTSLFPDHGEPAAFKEKTDG